MAPKKTHTAAEQPRQVKRQEPEAILDSSVSREQYLHDLQIHQIELEVQNEELQSTLRALEAANSRYADLYNFAPVGYFLMNHKGYITQLNYAAIKLLKLGSADLACQLNFGSFVATTDRIFFKRFLASVLNGTGLQHVEVKIDVGGETRIVQLEALGDDQECRTTMQDITKRKRAENDILKVNQELARTNVLLQRIAHFDTLTQLPNRVLLADRLCQALKVCSRRDVSLAVAYLDLDGFKAVNDQYGHMVGDRLLISIARRMKKALRKGDTLARIGGDEFVAVLVDLRFAEESEPVLKRLLKAAAEIVKVDDLSLQVTASIGVTLFPQDQGDADILMRHADQAMYIAKQSGKNRIHRFDIAFDAELQTHRASLLGIRKALAGDEFMLYYQPKVDILSGEVVGAEALIRWQHHERGLLLPLHFLPLVDSHPISVDIGEWVLEKVLTQMEQWEAEGLDMTVSANIGALQLQQESFPSRLANILAGHADVDPGKLELEIVESSALEDMEAITKVMNRCLKLGVHFTLDDFGTGYSSLTYLRRLPVDVLKIDQSFVRDMLNDDSDLAIIQGVIGLANAFNRRVVAEGVESSAQGKQLQVMGCHIAQGYGIAKPMPATELPGWIARWQEASAWPC